MNTVKIGVFTAEVVQALNLDVPAGTEILLGESNRRHMRETHPYEYQKYFDRITKILENPDFVGINNSDGSIEYIKEFGKHIKVAVRIANDGEYYARSMYSITSKRVVNFVKSGNLISLDKSKNI